MKNRLKIIFVAGARPNFVKIAPLLAECEKHSEFSAILVHTGQHYDEKLSKIFFEELKIPKPDINLNVGSGSPAEQTGKIMIKFDPILIKYKPDLVVVVGDVNSTIACSLAAAKRGIKIAHVEAGLRSFDWTMPEEINRVLTDSLSDFLFCTEKSAVKNLLKEGIPKRKIFFTGNVMIDTLEKSKVKCQKSNVLGEFGLKKGKYAVATIHRPSNVDDRQQLHAVLAILKKTGELLPILFPIHPRTEKNIKKWNLKTGNILLSPPLGYMDFMKAVSDAAVVLTDSGGIQEETTILDVPCLTMRENTERPVTVTSGTNQIVGTNEKKIISAVKRILRNPLKKKTRPPLWDGKASERIMKILMRCCR